MSRTKGVSRACSSHAWLEFAIWPRGSATFVGVTRKTIGPDGSRSRRIAYWYLDISREQLAGLPTHDVLCRVLDGLLRSLESGADHLSRDDAAVGTGAPLGATGGTVTEPKPPGEWPTPLPGNSL